ncbi:hypothetical protein TNCV_43501 [Trichonephila clavipes]|nr:hypothetical protein TNCV_43501 [Trichonephila clavipes]
MEESCEIEPETKNSEGMSLSTRPRGTRTKRKLTVPNDGFPRDRTSAVGLKIQNGEGEKNERRGETISSKSALGLKSRTLKDGKFA